MTSLFSAAFNLLGLVAISGAILLTGLVLRHPQSPTWLRSEGIAQAAALVLTTGVLLAISYAADGLTAANVHYGVAAILIGAVLAAASFVLWKALGIEERLERADEGQSPFARNR